MTRYDPQGSALRDPFGLSYDQEHVLPYDPRSDLREASHQWGELSHASVIEPPRTPLISLYDVLNAGTLGDFVGHTSPHLVRI